MNLKTKAYSGIRWVTFSFLSRAMLQLLQLSILARLLVPADFGLMAIVVSIVMVLQIFSDFGVSNAIVHYQNITSSQLSSLYWLNVSVGLVLGLLIVICSPLLAYFYSQPKLQFLLILASLSLLVSAVGQQFRVLAQKNMRFKQLTTVDLTVALIGFGVSIGVAMDNGGVYALIIGNLAGAITNTLLVCFFLADGWCPKFQLRLKEVKKFLKFGIYMIGNNLANTLNSQIDILLVGYFFNVQSLGLYNITKDLSLKVSGIINPIVTQVGFPLMAKAQKDKVLLKKIYCRSIRMTASVNFPIYTTLAIFSREILLLMLGEQWQEAAPLLQVFACWALVRSTANPVGSLVLACGRPDLEFKWNMALLLVMPTVICVGSQIGIMGLAIALLTTQIFLMIPSWYFLVRPLCDARFVEYFSQLFVPLALSLVSGCVAYLSRTIIDNEYPVVRLFLGLSAGGLCYIVISYFLNNVFWCAIIELFSVSPGSQENINN